MFVIKSVTLVSEKFRSSVTVAHERCVRMVEYFEINLHVAVRTGLRTMTRRLVRSILPVLLRLFLPAFKTSTQKDIEDLATENPQPIVLSLGLGLVALTL